MTEREGTKTLVYHPNPSCPSGRADWLVDVKDADGVYLGTYRPAKLAAQDENGTITALYINGIKTTPADVSPEVWQERLELAGFA